MSLKKKIETGMPMEDAFNEALGETRQFFDEQKAKAPEIYNTAEFASMFLPSSALGKLSKGKKFTNAVLQSALGGTYMASKAEKAEEMPEKFAEGAAYALGGEALGLGMQRMAPAAKDWAVRKIAPKLKEISTEFAAKVLKPSPTFFKKTIKNLPGKSVTDKARNLGEFMLKNDLVEESAEEMLTGASRLVKEAGEELGRFTDEASALMPPIETKRITKELLDPIDAALKKNFDSSRTQVMAELGGEFTEILQKDAVSLTELNRFRKTIDGKIPWKELAVRDATPKEKALLALRGSLSDYVDHQTQVGLTAARGSDGHKAMQAVRERFQYARSVEDLAAQRVPREFLSPEIMSKDLFTGMIANQLFPGSKTAAFVGTGIAGMVRKQGRRAIAKSFDIAETALTKPPARVKPPSPIFPVAGIYGGSQLEQ
jgi:hypothetical protein